MALKADELARREASTLLWREEPLRVAWQFDQLVSSDSHTIEGRFECSVRAARHEGDRQILVETFLGRAESLTVAHVVERLFAELRASLSGLISTQPVSAAMDPAQHSKWADTLRKAADRIAFSSGLELLAPISLHLHSPSFQRQKLRESAGARQKDDLIRATELLTQFQAMRQAAPDLPAGVLLKRFAEEDRGLAFESLLLADSSAAKTVPLWAVSGPCLVHVDPHVAPPTIRMFPLPPELGPLRSVQPESAGSSDTLLIGGQRGVAVVAASRPEQAVIYLHPSTPSLMGFNRVIRNSAGLWATHGEAGILHWKIDQASEPAAVFAEPEARNLEALDETRIVYSTGNTVVVREGEQRQSLDLPGHSAIIAILPACQLIHIVREDGTIQSLDRSTCRLTHTISRGVLLRAAGILSWQGDTRLLLATDQGPIDCIGMDDPLVSQYLSAHRGFKMIAASTDLIAAVSPDRQRVVVWKKWDPQRPVGEIQLTRHTRHRVADIAFGQ